MRLATRSISDERHDEVSSSEELRRFAPRPKHTQLRSILLASVGGGVCAGGARCAVRWCVGVCKYTCYCFYDNISGNIGIYLFIHNYCLCLGVCVYIYAA